MVAALCLASLLVPAASRAAVVADEIHYSFTGPTSVAFDWRGSAGDIRYGPTAAYGATALAQAPDPTPVSSAGPFWEVELTGLTAGTTYHYSIGGGPAQTFTTQPTGAFRFDVEADIGDSLDDPQTLPIQQQIAADHPSFVMVPGDLAYGDTHGLAAVDQHFNDVMAWSQTSAYMPTWGNHDWDPLATDDDLGDFKGRFAMENGQTSPGAPAASCCGEDWSWSDIGGVRFISYPEPYTSATWPDWGQRADGLMAEAQADPSIRFIVTYGHRPAYSTGHHVGVPALAAILDGLGERYPKYDVNFNAHSHDYERFERIHGVVHITSGGGGAGIEPPWSTTDPRTAFRAMHLAYLRVDVTDTSMHIEAVCGPASTLDDIVCDPGSVIDAVTIGTLVSPPTEFVENPGFEVDTSGWNASGGRKVNLQRVSGGHTGSWAALVENGDHHTLRRATFNDAPNWVTVTAPGAYVMSAWVRSATSSGVVKLRVRELQNGVRVGWKKRKLTLTTSWQQLALRYVAKVPGSSTLSLEVRSDLAAQTDFQVDDVSETLG